MSKKLAGLIKKEIKNAFGGELYDEQLNIMADALAKAIYTYLKDDVKTKPQKPTEKAPGPVTHVHIQTSHNLDPAN